MEPRPPALPADAPAAIADFVHGRIDTLELRAGRLNWLPLPPLVKRGPLGALITPTTTIEPTPDGASAILVARWPLVSMRLRVAVEAGELRIAPAGARHRLLADVYRGLDQWVSDANQWVAHTGRRFTTLHADPSRITIATATEQDL